MEDPFSSCKSFWPISKVKKCKSPEWKHGKHNILSKQGQSTLEINQTLS